MISDLLAIGDSSNHDAASALQARACGVLPSLAATPLPFPTVDVFVAFMWISSILLSSNKHLVTPRSLDVFCLLYYIVTLLGLLLIPVQTFEEYRQVMVRLNFCRVLPDVTTKRALMFVVFNVLGLVVVIARVIPVRELGKNQLDEAIVLDLAPVFGAVLVRQVARLQIMHGCRFRSFPKHEIPTPFDRGVVRDS